MRRTSLTFGVALSVVAVALVTFFYGVSSKQPQSATEPADSEDKQSQLSLSRSKEPSSSGVAEPRLANDDHRQTDDHHNSPANVALANVSYADEETDRQLLREEVTEEIRKLYPLLINDLDLSDEETEALFEFLIEDMIANTRTRYSSGQGLDKDERAARIAAIIGDTKLQQFMEREHSRRQYAEVVRVQSMLKQNGVPLSDSQRDDFLEILVDVRDHEKNLPGSDAKPSTMEALEYRISLVDEDDRLVLELAPSVLSAKQVEFLFNRYQAQSYRRAHSLEIQKELRADTGNEDIPLWYPARN